MVCAVVFRIELTKIHEVNGENCNLLQLTVQLFFHNHAKAKLQVSRAWGIQWDFSGVAWGRLVWNII